MALKIVKSARHYTETALDEIDLLKKVHISVCKSAVKQGGCQGGGGGVPVFPVGSCPDPTLSRGKGLVSRELGGVWALAYFPV